MKPTYSDNRADDAAAPGFAEMETPEELRPAPVVAEGLEAELPPALNRSRLARSPLVPRAVWIAVAGVVAVAVMVGVGGLIYANTGRIVVPDVTGTQLGVSRTHLDQIGLVVVVDEERFSSRPEGEVLSQSPAAGAKLRKGDAVHVVVSAGTEEFAMPDIVGDGLVLARGVLEGRGLAMDIEEVVSDQASGTVLGTTPAAGAMVRSGDTIRVSVAVPRPVSTGLEPFRMDGVAVLIDPVPVATGRPDAPLEVARRLRALLEASGAVVIVLRTGVDSSTADVDRAAAAAAATATIGIGLSASETGAAGRIVSGPGVSSALRAKLTQRLSADVPPSTNTSATSDPVLSSFRGPWARIVLGSYVQRSDETAFNDPGWADTAARAIYGVLGEVYGRREGL